MYNQLSTPAIAIELDAMEQNIKDLRQNAARYGIAHRPHIKTHRSTSLAKLQQNLGCTGITCAKLGEAEVMAAAGLTDILLCYTIIGEDKLARLDQLLNQAKVTTLINSFPGAEGLSQLGVRRGEPVRVLIDIDGGLKRGGIPVGQPALDFANQVKNLPGISIVGLLYYGGLYFQPKDRAEYQEVAAREGRELLETAKLLKEAGFSMEILSGGNSFSGKFPEQLAGITEVRSGTYIFNDCASLFTGFATEERCALRVVATVVGLVDAHHATLDAGSKALSSDLIGVHPGHGAIVGRPDILITKLNEEHAFIESKEPLNLQIGEKVAIIPNHACVVCNLFDEIYGIRNGAVKSVIRIDARGKSV